MPIDYDEGRLAYVEPFSVDPAHDVFASSSPSPLDTRGAAEGERQRVWKAFRHLERSLDRCGVVLEGEGRTREKGEWLRVVEADCACV